MDESIEQNLTVAVERATRRDQLQGQLAIARTQLEAADQELALAEQAAHVEGEDVRKLETFSATRMWAAVRGARESDLAREQAEHQLALAKVAESNARRELIARDLAEIEINLDELGDVDAGVAEALRAKEAAVLHGGGSTAETLGALAAERGRLEAERAELREADSTGRAALDALNMLRSALGSASGWSSYDTWFGGGMMSSSMKHQQMDQAAEIARHVDQALRVFTRELGDVGMAAVQSSLEISQGTRFMDVWFDNIFTDMAVAERIRDAIAQTEALQRDVAARLDGCYQRALAATERIAQIEQERAAILTG